MDVGEGGCRVDHAEQVVDAQVCVSPGGLHGSGCQASLDCFCRDSHLLIRNDRRVEALRDTLRALCMLARQLQSALQLTQDADF